MKRIIQTLLLTLASATILFSQTFTDRRVINSQSVETLRKNHLEFRVAHRFGDMFGAAGGWSTFYGLENASDVLIGFNYGLTDNFLISLNRTAGAGLLRKLINTGFKWKVADQFGENPKFLTVAIAGVVSVSTARASEDEDAIDHFPVFSHRVAYTTELLLARKWSEFLSTQVIGGYQHRNVVFDYDQNALFFVGFSSRIRFTKGFAILLDSNFPLSRKAPPDNIEFFPALGFGVELNTGGGHVFQINLTNSKGLIENDFIPYTQSDLTMGEFRLGFTITRIFRV